MTIASASNGLDADRRDEGGGEHRRVPDPEIQAEREVHAIGVPARSNLLNGSTVVDGIVHVQFRTSGQGPSATRKDPGCWTRK